MITLSIIPISIVVSKKMISKTHLLNKDIKLNQEINNEYYHDILNNFPVISLFGGYKKEVDYYSKMKNSLKESEKKLAKELDIFWLSMNILRVIVLITSMLFVLI